MKNLSYLEEVEGKEALEFVRENSNNTVNELKSSPEYKELDRDLRTIFTASDRMSLPSRVGDYLYNFWTDEKNEKGLFRRTTLDSYKTEAPIWETVLDIDKLSLDEGVSWVWGGSNTYEGNYKNTLITLSVGGKDASVIREFDLEKKQFVNGGFYIPESKCDVSWVTENEVLVAAALDEESSTTSGYARFVKRLIRGEDLNLAPIIYQGDFEDLGVSGGHDYFENKTFIHRTISFYESESYLLENNELTLIPVPTDAALQGMFKGQLIYRTSSELNGLPAGSVISLPLSEIKRPDFLSLAKVIFKPSQSKFLSSVSFTKNFLLIEVLDNVISKLDKASLENEEWVVTPSFDAETLAISLVDTSDHDDTICFLLSNFVTSSTLFEYDLNSGNKTLLKKGKERFDSSHLQSVQKWAKSADGTMIPYFLISKKDLTLDGKNPTLLYGYGGFESNMEPYYSAVIGKSWLERGGVYAMANIRGGGEFGPLWHQAALKEKRHKSFEDFIAISEHLIETKVTSPRHLGIQGGSNGGLLVGAVMTQRPELFNAVLCEVPLLDMLNYHTLLAGASWMDEYGDPRIEEERKALESYSPLHKLSHDQSYPKVFFLTSTKDDRVHPSHARKMFARMKELGKDAYYFENFEGGHSGTANIEQDVLWYALEFTYLWKMLK